MRWPSCRSAGPAFASSFAKSGDPNGPGLPAWPAFDVEREAYLVLGERVSIGEGLRRDTCDLLDELRADRPAARGE